MRDEQQPSGLWIVESKPPEWIWEAVHEQFDIDDRYTIYCYGNTLHNPAGLQIPEELIAHEDTHRRQQGGNPAAWWRRYLKDPEFRFRQECEAYRNQYVKWCEKNRGREQRYAYAVQLARILAGPMYGIGYPVGHALRQIRGEVH